MEERRPATCEEVMQELMFFRKVLFLSIVSKQRFVIMSVIGNLPSAFKILVAFRTFIAKTICISASYFHFLLNTFKIIIFDHFFSCSSSQLKFYDFFIFSKSPCQ
jgi:hypothetical protein